MISKKIIILIKDTLKLDIVELNYAKSSQVMNYQEVLEKYSLTKKGIFTRVSSFFYHFLLASRTIRSKCYKQKNTDIIALVNSKNQKDALVFLEDLPEKVTLMGIETSNVVNYPIFYAYILSLFFLPLAIIKFFNSSGYVKNSFKFAFDEYILCYGFYLLSRIFLNKCGTKAVIVANDHSILPRTFTKAAKDEKITTLYIQHASISEISQFPKLEFDYAFLDGEDSLLKYEKSGSSNTKVFLTGVPKFDKYFLKINNNNHLCSLGVATTNIEDIEIVEKTVAELRISFPKMEIVLRPHPGDKKFNTYKEISKRYFLTFSDSQKENSFDFLSVIDVLIAGDSGIILDAAMMNVFPIRYTFVNVETDNYGFIRNGLVNNCYNNLNDLKKQLKSLVLFKENIRPKAKKYCSNINTKYDGMSALLIDKLLNEIQSNGQGFTVEWSKDTFLTNLKHVYTIAN